MDTYLVMLGKIMPLRPRAYFEALWQKEPGFKIVER